MAKAESRSNEPGDAALLALFRSIATGDHADVASQLSSAPGLADCPIRVGASRRDPEPYFLTEIGHYVYAGDTALHIASAAYQGTLAERLVAGGAAVRARNRRGAEPLHYAADGSPGAEQWDPEAQREVIAFLIAAGADPDARDKGGVAPLHRAVRTRCSAAVIALIRGGADPRLMNTGGSTPLHLAVQNTGRSSSGSDAANEEQARIIAVLIQHGASPTDVDAKGTTVIAAATSAWIRELLNLGGGRRSGG